jgi:hypothetical protein
MRCSYLVFPSCTSTTPYSSPKVSSRGRNASNARPSSRMRSCSAWRMNARSLTEMSASRGILYPKYCKMVLSLNCFCCHRLHQPVKLWRGRAFAASLVLLGGSRSCRISAFVNSNLNIDFNPSKQTPLHTTRSTYIHLHDDDRS